MKTKKLIASALVATLALGLFAGCGGKDDSQGAASGDDKVITIGASPSPHAEILNHFAGDFEKEGYKLEVVEFTDYVQPNKALDNGDLDANYFQHNPYLENFCEENGTKLVNAGAIHYEPMGIFSDSITDLSALPEGAKVAVPNDATNEARALLLLQENGLIKLKEGVDITATKLDIAENPKNLEIIELEAAQIPRSLQDVDIAVVNGNYALDAGLSLDDALKIEAADSLAAKTYANIIAVREGDVDTAKTQVIIKVLTSDAAKKYIEETFNGAVLPSAAEEK